MPVDPVVEPNPTDGHVDSQVVKPDEWDTFTSTDTRTDTTASMFNNAKNTRIKGGSFNNYITTNTTTNVKTTYKRSLNVLHKRVAPHAILNAGGRADVVQCHPGTRTEVIGRIEKWRVEAQNTPASPIFWLSGPAGAGKSAIVQTVAEQWKKDEIPQANFFFFRTDPSRDNTPPLVATLAHQIILLYPSVRDLVEAALSTNPLILDSSIEEQLMELIINPLHALRKSSPAYSSPVLLIDGLDECDAGEKDGQRQILHAFDKALTAHPGLICLLVASRDESQIQATFNRVSSPLITLYLDDKYSPENDIRLVVEHEFKMIRLTHPLAHTLDETWPPPENVDDIVERSSGQFVFAITVMRFIAHSSASPMLSLERVQVAAEKTSSKSPFSQLDAIYTYIISQVGDQEALRDILHAYFLLGSSQITTFPKQRGKPDPMRPLMMFTPATHFAYGVTLEALLKICRPGYTKAVIISTLADLAPVARYADGKLFFHHASFTDYLHSQSRAGSNCVDVDAFAFKALPDIWKYADTVPTMYVVAIAGLTRLKELPTNLLSILVTLELYGFTSHDVIWEGALRDIHNLCTSEDDFIKYAQIIRQWISISSFSVYNELNDDSLPRCIVRYFLVLCLEEDTWPPETDVMVALSPKTDLEIRETTIWLRDLLYRVHGDINGDAKKKARYMRVLKRCISYAFTARIPFDALEIDDLPGVRRYYWERRMRLWTVALNTVMGGDVNLQYIIASVANHLVHAVTG